MPKIRAPQDKLHLIKAGLVGVRGSAWLRQVGGGQRACDDAWRCGESQPSDTRQYEAWQGNRKQFKSL
ncbi:hypothetical protein E2C01_081289 [Portunus trituberculatus]|uniref:Uncharacterized protein n=1 Tax=Portunus trituberculatus TaxID=210409 RepID=A0A5B7IPC7_PORTR|nr:hypothetical protein [Portunus trituberculatus]